MADVPASTNAGSVAALSPPWLLKDNNEKYMRNLGNAIDTIVDKVKQGVEARLPGVGTVTALPYIGLDRMMPRAPTEADNEYITRLREAYDTWQRAGSRPTVLRQVNTYLGTRVARFINQVPLVLTVGNSQDDDIASWDWYYGYDAITDPLNFVKEPQRALINPTNWNWDGTYPWWRTWLVICAAPGSTIGPEATWGSGTWNQSGGSWGLNIGPEFADGLTATVRLWKSANTFYPWIIIHFNPGLGAGAPYSPNSGQGSGNPDGTWGRWGKLVGTTYVAARPNDSRFLDGTGVYQDATVPTGT